MTNPKNDEPKDDQEVLKTFDMYHFFARKDVILAIAFVVAFLIFALAALLAPQVV